MPGTLSVGSDELLDPPPYRLLLDQNFPKPPGFDLSRVDHAVEAVHLADFDVSLTKAQTPDWLIYLRAARAHFHALVTRDAEQLALPEELWVLTQVNLTLVTFRRAIEDPIVEWGQLLAFLPLIRRRSPDRRSSIIHLPKPVLGESTRPQGLLHRIAADTGISAQQLRTQAKSNIRDYLTDHGFHDVLASLSL